MEDSSHLEEELFQAALERPAAERAEFLKTACAGDAELRNRVLELLAAHGRAEGFMELANADLAGPGSLGSHSQQPPDSVGPYKLLEKIGEGGCGVVYRAEQQHPIRRVVAVKIIKLGMDTRSVIARFQAERQALAMMDHPNIAKVLDAGTTESGRPYFVMELVSGARITRYCDENQLSTTQRLNLFIQICNAVQHAHQKGIIHRDIKPSNILVTQHDGIAVPKIIDFGIAKATQGRLADHTDFTAVEQFIGTPAYMSPEQAEMSGIDIDTRSDIYSLGVLLYELLTGRTPFELGDAIKTGLDEMRRRIREDEPMAPSTRLSSLENDSATTIANFRRTDPPRLVRSIRGDLDWIVMKCLEKDRARRYETANGLAVDVKRHLSNEAVIARPPGRVYRFKKMVRRNNLAFTAALLVILVTVAAAAISTWQAMRATRAERSATAEEAIAQTQQRIAEDTSRDLRKNLYFAQMNLCSQLLDVSGGTGQLDAFLAPWRIGSDLRGWEWYFLNGEAHREMMLLPYHQNNVGSVAWSPDGTMIASGSSDREIHICDAETGMLLRVLRGRDAGVSSLAWNPDSRRLASGGSTGDPSVQVWDVITGQMIRHLPGHRGGVGSLSWEPNGTRLVSASTDGTLKIWDVENSKIANEYSVPNTAMSAVSWCPTMSRIACALNNGHIHIINSETMKLEQNPDRSFDAVQALAWSPDGRQLVWCGSAQFAIVIWKPDEPALPKGTFGHRAPLASVGWSPDGKWIATASREDYTVAIFDAATGKLNHLIPGHSGPLNAVAWAPDSRRIVSASADHSVRIWDALSPSPTRTSLDFARAQNEITWSPDGSRLAAAGLDKSIRIWSAYVGGAPKILKAHDGEVRSIAWSPDGRWIASGGDDKFVKLWDAEKEIEFASLPGHAYSVTSLAWTADSKRLASSDNRGIVDIWTLDPPTKQFNFDSRGGSSVKLAWSSDGTTLATTSSNGYIRTWNGSDDKPIRTFFGRTVASDSVAWNPHNRQFAVGGYDGVAMVFDADSGELLANLRGHTSAIRQIRWSADGTRLLSGGLDRTIRIWDFNSAKQLLALTGTAPAVWTTDWSRDGLRVAGAGPLPPGTIYDATMGYAVERSPKIISELERRLGLQPGNSSIMRMLLECYASRGSWDAAALLADKLLAANNGTDRNWYQTGWWVAGLYSPDLGIHYGPELRGGEPNEPTTASDGSSLQWQRMPLGATGFLDPTVLYPKLHSASIYATTKVYTPSQRDVAFIIRCQCPMLAWLNGQSLPTGAATTRPTTASDTQTIAIPARLQRGWNTLLVRIAQGDLPAAPIVSSTTETIRPEFGDQPRLILSIFPADSPMAAQRE